jgi:hypothetical protein
MLSKSPAFEGDRKMKLIKKNETIADFNEKKALKKAHLPEGRLSFVLFSFFEVLQNPHSC